MIQHLLYSASDLAIELEALKVPGPTGKCEHGCEAPRLWSLDTRSTRGGSPIDVDPSSALEKPLSPCIETAGLHSHC